MIEIIRIPALKDNYIWLIQNTLTQCAAVVDPGDAKPVLAKLRTDNIQLKAILLTHHHWDHCNGIAKLLDHFDVPVYGSQKEPNAHCSHFLQENDSIFLKDLQIELKILEVPGHTLGHIVYVGENFIFTGDTLFTGGCGRLFEGTAEQMLQSLKKLKNLPLEMLIYCGHEYTLTNLEFAITLEPENAVLLERLQLTKTQRSLKIATVPSTLDLELKTNPFLRTHVPVIINAVNLNSLENKISKEAEIFLKIRTMKDNFKSSL